MKGKRLLLPALALALSLLCGCGAFSQGEPFGRNIFFTRTATDEEAFSLVLDQETEGEDLDIPDENVPLSSLPVKTEETLEEGWLLVRYTKDADGVVEPQWYRVWTEEDCWSEDVLPYNGGEWHPELPPPVVRPLG